MSLWPPPRQVETRNDEPPLVLPAGTALPLLVTVEGGHGADAADTAGPGESRPEAGQAARSASEKRTELAFAVAGLHRALAVAEWTLAAGPPDLRPRAPGEAAGPPSMSKPGPDAASFLPDDATEANPATPVCRILVGTTGADDSQPTTVPTDESHSLRLDAAGIAIRAATPTGVFRAAATLKQWLAAKGRATAAGFEVQAVRVDDRPDVPIRGVMLDVSRNRVPTMAYLERLVDRLADWKVNHVQLYMEHTFAYAGHEEVWRDASPFTADELRTLDARCRERFMELAPNQNSFGHFHRWLVHDRYRPLAEVPEGLKHFFSVDPEPFSLCPTDPRVPELIDDLHDQLLPLFRSKRFNVGLDETFDLGLGRSAEACEERGKAAVYLEFLHRVHDRVTARGRQMLFWGDIVLEHPELVEQVPEDAVLLCWGYEADHPFADHCARLQDSGREFWVCPGTSSWQSFGGRLHNAVGNLASAAIAGSGGGASGVLITDWGDHGHLQPPAIAELPLSIGAGFVWSLDAAQEACDASERNEAAWLDHAIGHVYDGDETLARAVVELGAVAVDCGGPARNGSPLFSLLRFIDEDLTHRRFAGLSIARLQGTFARLAELRVGLADSAACADIDWTCRMMSWCCRLGIERLAAGRDAAVAGLASRVRIALAAELRQLADELPVAWLATSRPGGLQNSQALLERAAAMLDDDEPEAGR